LYGRRLSAFFKFGFYECIVFVKLYRNFLRLAGENNTYKDMVWHFVF